MPDSGLEETARWIVDTDKSSVEASHDCDGSIHVADGSVVGATLPNVVLQL